LIQILAKKYNLPYANLAAMTIDLDYLKLVPENRTREAKWLSFREWVKTADRAAASR